MANVLGENCILQIFTTSGSLDVSGDFNSSDLNYSRNNPDVTTYGKTTIQRIAGLRDYTLNFSGIFNSGVNTAFTYILADVAASLPTLFKWAPGGSISGSPYFTGSAMFSDFKVNAPHNAAVAMSMTLQAAAGSLTAACSV